MTPKPNPTSFRYDEKDGIATIGLARPERLNSLTFEVYAELRDVFRALGSRAPVRSVLLTGEGRGFSSGGDREDIIAKLFERDAAGVTEFARMTCDTVLAMRTCPKPVVAAINGACVGAGAMLALASDFRYAVKEAKFGFVFTKVGISGADMGATLLLPRIVGWTKATELLMTGDLFDANEALRIGFLNAIVPSEDLLATTRALAQKLAAGPSFGLAMTKSMLNRQISAPLEGALAAEAEAQSLCMLHPDFREAYTALHGKRAPRFS